MNTYETSSYCTHRRCRNHSCRKGYFAGGTIIYGYLTPTNTKRVDIYTAPSRIVAEEMINPIMEMQLYPNPAHDIITC
ncbi:MAG: hypothetical protein IPL12_22875 [Bacteroidetes bacterium]|nr:hypothetical protein [Bacteroidota bacterium]